MQFRDGSELIFREFLDVSRADPRLMYAYQYQDAAQNLLFRYDSAVHRPRLSSLEHKHTPAGIEIAVAPTLAELLDSLLTSMGL